MSDLVRDLTPQNLLEEKAKFFADTSYNPQFHYVRSFVPEELTAWGLPKEKYARHAEMMLAEIPASSPSNSEVVTPEYIEAMIGRFNQRYNLKEPIVAHFSEHQVSRCWISGSNIYFQLPIHYTKEKIGDLYRHELETHVLRRLNHERNFPGRPVEEIVFRRTEEGLASMHSFLLRENKIIKKSYHTYIAVWYAQHASFSEVYHKLRSYNVSEQLSWNIALRTKRGLTDTSQPGGFTKDIVYFEGKLDIWQWVTNPHNDPRDLYLGRLSLDEVDTERTRLSSAQREQLLFPSFFDNIESYRQNIAEVGRVNRLELLK